MASALHLSYAEQLYKKYGFQANYPPEKVVRIGDVGILEGHLFRRRDTLTALTGLKAAPRDEPKPIKGIDNRFFLATGNETDVNFKAKGDVDLVHAGLEIILKTANSIFFNAADIRVQEIESQLILGRSILDLYKQGKWEKEWVLVTVIYISKSTLIFGSASGNSKILLEAKTDVPAIDLGNAELLFGIKDQSTLQMNIIDNKDNICLIETASIKKKGNWPFGKDQFALADEGDPTNEELLDRVRDGDYDIEELFEFSKD